MKPSWWEAKLVATDCIHKLQSRTKLLEKVFPIMSTFLRNKTISKTTPLRKEKTLPPIQFCFPQMPRDQAFF